jgi:anoctamin-7
MELNNLSIFTRKGLFVFVPLKDIKDYYGSAVAFYFAWLSFYTAWNWVAAIVGLLVFIYGLVTALNSDTADTFTQAFALTFDNALTIPFTIFTSIWAIVFLECWKRQEAILKTLWGVENLSRASTRRPEFSIHLC